MASSTQSNTTGGFPLRTTFFRSLPLNKEKNDGLYALAKQNATACLNQSFNDQWRYVPPEKDGTQIRKDTSNMAASYRLVRAATVLRCQEHELNQVTSNTTTESWREFARKCFGKYFVDTIILHAVTNPVSRSSSDNQHRHGRSESELTAPKVYPSHYDADVDASRPSDWQKSGGEYELGSSSAMPVVSCSFLGGESYDAVSLDADTVSNQDDEQSMLCEQADEVVTAKWGVFDTGLTGKRDMCVVDYLSLAYIPNTDRQEQVHVWCFTSTDGDNIGCMELKDTHNVNRSKLTKLGVFWRRLSDEETEVIVCGSFPSKHAQGVSSILLASLNRLQGIVEDLRLSNQVYIHRSTWVKDKERTSCHLCMRNFHALRRKHHCRKCGEVICSDCSHVETIDLPLIGESKLRLCKVCGIRARSTPLKRLDRSNVFDRLVRARSLSNLHAADSPFSRASYAESKLDDDGGSGGSSSNHSIDGSALTTPSHHTNQSRHHHHLGGHGLEARTHSSSDYSSSAASGTNNDADLDDLADAIPMLSSSSNSMSNNTTATTTAAPIHPISRSTHPEDFDDFLGSRSLKTQLAALEATPLPLSKQQTTTAGSNSNMFDLLCELACQTLTCPIASVCIVDGEGTFVRSAAGLDGNVGLDDELALFIDKVMGSTPAIVLDANVDKQVQHVFAKRGAAPEIRFFAGCPIYSRTSRKLGYVCVADLTKRDTIGASCAFTMERLATLAVTTMERNINAKLQQQEREREREQQLRQQQQQQQQQQLNHSMSMPATTTTTPSHATTQADRPASSGYPGRMEPTNNNATALAGRGYEVVDETPSQSPATPSATANGEKRDYSAGYYEAQARMKKLLAKSYNTQQQLATGSSPTTHLLSPSSHR